MKRTNYVVRIFLLGILLLTASLGQTIVHGYGDGEDGEEEEPCDEEEPKDKEVENPKDGDLNKTLDYRRRLEHLKDQKKIF